MDPNPIEKICPIMPVKTLTLTHTVVLKKTPKYATLLPYTSGKVFLFRKKRNQEQFRGIKGINALY